MSREAWKPRVRQALDGRDPRFGRGIAFVSYGAIVVSALIITFQSMPVFDAQFGLWLLVIEWGVLIVFCAEYLARLWSAPSRWRYALSFWGLIDLLSIIPALLFIYPDAQVLRSLRLLRIVMLLKLLRVRRAFERLEHAVIQSRDELLLFVFLAAIVLFLSAVGIYHLEHDAQPETFGSIPQSLWWALATLTTVGYGDVYPVTAGGKAFTAITLLVGLGIVAIPAGIMTSALLVAPDRADTPAKDETDNERESS